MLVKQVARQFNLLFEQEYAINPEAAVNSDGSKKPVAHEVMNRLGGLNMILNLLQSKHLLWKRCGPTRSYRGLRQDLEFCLGRSIVRGYTLTCVHPRVSAAEGRCFASQDETAFVIVFFSFAKKTRESSSFRPPFLPLSCTLWSAFHLQMYWCAG